MRALVPYAVNKWLTNCYREFPYRKHFLSGVASTGRLNSAFLFQRGPPDSPYAGGEYHGVLLFPSEYPFKPPGIKVRLLPALWPKVDVMLITVLRLDVHPIWPLPSRQKDLFLYVGFPPRISKRYSPPNFRWMADNFFSSGTLHGVSRRCEFTSWTSRWWLADG